MKSRHRQSLPVDKKIWCWTPLKGGSEHPPEVRMGGASFQLLCMTDRWPCFVCWSYLHVLIVCVSDGTDPKQQQQQRNG